MTTTINIYKYLLKPNKVFGKEKHIYQNIFETIKIYEQEQSNVCERLYLQL